MTEIEEIARLALALGASPRLVQEGVRFYKVDQCVVGIDPDNLQPGWCIDAGIQRFADNPWSRDPDAPTTTDYMPAWRRGPFALGVTDRDEALAALRREVP